MTYYYIEVFVISVVIIIQIVISINLIIKIFDFTELFTSPLKLRYGYIDRKDLNKTKKSLDDVVFFDEDSEETKEKFNDKKIVKIALLETSGKSREIITIKKAINSYLLNNYGAAVNFSIIKDIIDRVMDNEDDGISQGISIPLYLGLAAAMFGIIFGLLAMPDLSGDNFIKDIEPLLRGVKIALIASLNGLFWTTLLSSFIYRNAKKSILEGKNNQLNDLLETLLPELIKAEDTGVSGLKASLDRFARVASEISDNVLIAANQTGENIILQQEVLDRVERINVTKVSKANLELFDRLEISLEAINKLSEFISSMVDISTNLREFAAKTTNIDKLTSQIDTSLKESVKLNKFLTLHFEKIETAGSAALKAVDLTDAYFKDAIRKLQTELDNSFENLRKTASIHESDLLGIYNKIGKELNEITSKHLSEFQKAYQGAVPDFNQLNHLELLPGFQEKVSLNATQLQGLNNNSEQFSQNINKLHTTLLSLKQHMGNGEILEKLGSIENHLKRKGISNTSGTPGRPPKKKGFIEKSLTRIRGYWGNKKV